MTKALFKIWTAAILFFHLPTTAGSERKVESHPMNANDVLAVVKNLSKLETFNLKEVEQVLELDGKLKVKSQNDVVVFYEQEAPSNVWKEVDLRLPLPNNQTFKGFLVLKPLSAIKIKKPEIAAFFSTAVSEQPHIIFDQPPTDETVLKLAIQPTKISFVVNKTDVLQYVALDPSL